MKTMNFSHNQHHSARSRKTRKGFSIVEVAIAMGVVTLLLTTFLGVFGPAQKNVQKALHTRDANRMKDELSKEMSVLRTTDGYNSAFEKAYEMMKGSHAKASAVIMYQYKADPTSNPASGILAPYTGDDGIQGQDYIMQTAVRTIGQDDDTIEAELEPGVIDGPVFVVRMTQLVRDDASTDDKLILSAWTSGDDLSSGLTDPDAPGTPIDNVADYPKAVIAFKAEFFKLNVNKIEYVTGGAWEFGNLGSAITEVNMAVRR